MEPFDEHDLTDNIDVDEHARRSRVAENGTNHPDGQQTTVVISALSGNTTR